MSKFRRNVARICIGVMIGFLLLMSTNAPATNECVITSVARTNDQVNLTIHLPDNQSLRVDIYSIYELLGFPWSLVTTTPTTSGTIRVTLTESATKTFYRSGDADTDSDADGISDTRERFLYGTNPNATDTDSDGLNDYSEISTYHTDPNMWDTDGDGMSDGWEVANGHNPLDPNDPPNVSGVISYSGRQTGLIWVVAVTSSNNWATNNAVLLSNEGAYLIPNLTGSNYFLKAWRDSADNGSPDTTEAFGIFSTNSICVTNQVKGINIALIDPDTNTNSLPDWWEVKYFGGINNCNPADDIDCDQYTNLEEYNAGTDPLNAANHPWTVSGTIFYSGMQTGTIHVIASTSADGWTGVSSTTITMPGKYTIMHLPPDTTYWIKAYRDSAGIGSNVFWAARGICTNNPINLNTNVADRNVTIVDPDTDGDGMSDWYEVKYGLDPYNPNTADGGWWKFDETSGNTAQDASGNNNIGALSNMSANAWIGGVISNALVFDGASSFIQLSDNDKLKPNYVSVALWINPTITMSNGSAVFFSKKQPGSATGYRLSYEQGALSFLACASGSLTVSVPITLSSGVWHHVTGIFGGSSQSLYIDGILRTNVIYNWGSGFGTLDQGTTPPRVGASTDTTPTNFFAGCIDDLRIYGRALASNEVHAAYELGADSDGDGLSTWRESQLGSNPNSVDSDNDGLLDAWEVTFGTDPANPNDPPSLVPSISGTISYAGLLPGRIYVMAVTSSNSWALDHSYSLSQPGPYLIRNLPATNYWIKAFRDVDGDGNHDTWEPIGWLPTSPIQVSSCVNGANISLSDPDRDGDGLSDYDELYVYFTDPNNTDTDGDGLTDKQEVVLYHTSPFVNDSDYDNKHNPDIHDAQAWSFPEASQFVQPPRRQGRQDQQIRCFRLRRDNVWATWRTWRLGG